MLLVFFSFKARHNQVIRKQLQVDNKQFIFYYYFNFKKWKPLIMLPGEIDCICCYRIYIYQSLYSLGRNSFILIWYSCHFLYKFFRKITQNRSNNIIYSDISDFCIFLIHYCNKLFFPEKKLIVGLKQIK